MTRDAAARLIRCNLPHLRMKQMQNGKTTIRPGLPRVELVPTPRFFERFSLLDPVDQGQIIDVLKHMHRGQGFNDAIGEVRGREGGHTTPPKAWRDL